MGTPDYMAPEQAANAGPVDIRADIYSLGATLYYLLSGQVLFPDGTGIDKVNAQIKRVPVALADRRVDVSPDLVAVIDRMLAKDPAQRYQTPAEVARALANLATPSKTKGTESSFAESASGTEPPRRWPRILLAAGGFGLVGGLLALAILAEREHDETMSNYLTTFYMACAVLGGTLLVCQFLLSLLGHGAHHDVDAHDSGDFSGHDLHAEGSHETHHESHGTGFIRLLTFRTVVAALTFFGLGGRAAAAASLDPVRTLGWALAAGVGALFLVAWLIQSLYRLKAEGTVRMARAVGRRGTVYLTIPGRRAGAGKVHLNLQNRTVECQAVTDQEALPTGSKVQVAAVLGPDTVLVIPSVDECET
jgi:hypothetical protein